MLKKKIIGLVLLAGLLITACGSDAAQVGEVDAVAESISSEMDDSIKDIETEDGSESSAEKTREELRADFANNALPPASQLVVGTLMLEDTEYAVDAELAPYLIPYWKLYKTLLESDTTAPEELEALITEIQEVMSPDQVNYIAGLELTQEDLMSLVADLGIFEQLGAEGSGDGTGPGFQRPDGMPEGMRPGGGQGGAGAVDGIDPEVQATMQAKREETGGVGGMQTRVLVPLVDALIELLENKAD